MKLWDRLLAVALIVLVIGQAVAIVVSWGDGYWLSGVVSGAVVGGLAVHRRRQPCWYWPGSCMTSSPTTSPASSSRPRRRSWSNRINQEIAAELFSSRSTVKSHVAGIQTKLGARNRVGIAAWAWEHRLPS